MIPFQESAAVAALSLCRVPAPVLLRARGCACALELFCASSRGPKKRKNSCCYLQVSRSARSSLKECCSL